MAKEKLVQHDTLPEINLFLYDEVTGNHIDISDPLTVVRLYFRQVGQTVLKDTLILNKLPGLVTDIDEETGNQTINFAPPYDVAGFGGRAAIQWGPTTLDTTGQFEGEIEITFADGSKLTRFAIYQYEIRQDFNGS